MKLQYKVYREVSIFYFSAPCFRMFPLAQKYLNSQVRTNKLTNCSLPPWSKIRLNGTSFHVFLNSLGFYLSTDCLLNFLQLLYSTIWGKYFNLWCSHSQKMHWIYVFLLMSQFPTQNSRQNHLKICFPQEKRGGGNYVICFFKIQTENMKMTWNISFYLYFVWFVIFLNMMALQFCEKYLSNKVLLSLLSLLCNHGN